MDGEKGWEEFVVPICQNCGTKWSWFSSIKKLLTFRKSMKCSHCGKIQYQSASSRNTTSLVILFPLITIPITVLFDLSLISIFLLDIPLFFLSLLIMPLFLKLTDKDEPLW
ncbi:TIGR04104 family putative zinc finger protein [Bacillus marasmi]|uniref:TIGR04104 family putative zinc finger protein n=1 Tax=Bacillus marasmi TaxID=1926279 RepID=UPI00319D9D4F